METKTIIRVLMEDGETCHDYASEYGEPGYSSEGPILFGNWWCRKRYCSYSETYANGDKKVHALELHYPRVFAALEDAGCEFQWDDEWVVIDDKAYRTEPDSYSWQPTAVFNGDTGDYMIAGVNIEEWLAWAVNDPHRCLMANTFSDAELEAEGFVERQCDYESGWYGVHDDPPKIAEAIQERENVDVLFVLSGTEQFRVTFCVYVRERESSESE